MQGIAAQEQAKYAAMWDVEDYAQAPSPGAQLADLFVDMMGIRTKLAHETSIIDFGAGHGAGSRALKDKGFAVAAFDIAAGNWPHKDIGLVEGCLWNFESYGGLRDWGDWDHGYCCDVMEHLPAEYTALAVANMLRVCKSVFFSISFQPDYFGRYINEPLHLTVKPFAWWRDMLREIGHLTEARDLLGTGVFYLTRRT